MQSIPIILPAISTHPNKRLGELLIESSAGQLAELIKYMKKENTIKQLQDEFFDRAESPLKK